MGACTTILYLSKYWGGGSKIECVILEGGFGNIRSLIYYLGIAAGMDDQALDIAFGLADDGIHEKAGFHIRDLDVEKAAKKCKEPAYFLHVSSGESMDAQNA